MQTRCFGTASLSTRHDRTILENTSRLGIEGRLADVVSCRHGSGDGRNGGSRRADSARLVSILPHDDEGSKKWACATPCDDMWYATDDILATNPF